MNTSAAAAAALCRYNNNGGGGGGGVCHTHTIYYIIGSIRFQLPTASGWRRGQSAK